jgi:hypothetical protein
LASQVSQLNGKTDSTNLHTIPKEEVLNMCASGKDRTSVAEHDQTARAISASTGIEVSQIDAQLIRSGHTASFTGGINTGGGSIGCYGTKEVSLPSKREEGISGIQEVSANGNNLEKPGLLFKMKRMISKLFSKEPETPAVPSVVANLQPAKVLAKGMSIEHSKSLEHSAKLQKGFQQRGSSTVTSQS